MTIQQDATDLIRGATNEQGSINTEGLAHYVASEQSKNMPYGTDLYHEIRGQLPTAEWQGNFDAWMTDTHQKMYTRTGDDTYSTAPVPESRSRRRDSGSSGDSSSGDPNVVYRALRPFETNPMQDGIRAPEGSVPTSVRDHVRYGSDRTRDPSDVVSFTRSEKYVAAYATRKGDDPGTGYYAKGTLEPGSEYYDSARPDHQRQAFPPKRQRDQKSRDPAVNYAKGAQEVMVKARNGEAMSGDNVTATSRSERVTEAEYMAAKKMSDKQLAEKYPGLRKMVATRQKANERPHYIFIYRHEGQIRLPEPNRVPGSTRSMTQTGEGSGSQSIRHSRS
jgi:hypothetical protein